MAATDVRQTEVTNAANNPNIISPLVGSSSQDTPITAPASSGPPAGYNEANQAAQDLSGKLYGGGYVSGAEGQRDQAMRELFAYDKQLEAGQSPFPQVAGYVDNPADLYAGGAAYARGASGIISGLSGTVSDTERAYQTATTSLLDKIIDLFTLQENRKEKDADREFQKKQAEFDTALAIAKITGGRVTNPFTGESVNIPAGGGRTLSAGEIEANRINNQALSDIKGGWTPKDLFAKYGKSIGFNDILTAYSQNSPYGPPKESVDELRRIYDSYSSGSSSSSPELSAEEYKRKDLVESGLRGMVDYQKLISTGDGGFNSSKLALAGLPGSFGGRDVDSAAYRAADAILRLRTGAQAPESEVRRYRDSMFPRWGDSDQTISQKIQSVWNDLSGAIKNLPPGTMLRVKDKSSGQTGTIPVEEFDYNTYEVL